jgi:hypothetical protein
MKRNVCVKISQILLKASILGTRMIHWALSKLDQISKSCVDREIIENILVLKV